MESLESRHLLAQVTLTAVADGKIADTDLDGTYETLTTNGNTITDRWFTSSGIGQERGAFEFDLSSIPEGSTLTAAKLGLYVPLKSGALPELVFRSYAGDGVINLSDAEAVSMAAGTGTVSELGNHEFTLDPAAIEFHLGGHVGLRMQNTALNADWVGVYSLEGFGSSPTLVLDYESAALSVDVQASSISESAGPSAATVLVTRNGDLSESLAVALSSSDPSEAAIASAVTIPAFASSVQVPLSAIDDFQVDGTQTVSITASSSGFLSGSDTVDVTDDDVAGVTVSAAAGLTTTEAGGSAEFTIVLDSEPTADVSINLTSSDVTEATVFPSVVTFTPSNWNSAQTVTVTGVDDAVSDGNQAVTIVTSIASSQDLNYGSFADPVVLDDVERGEFNAAGSNLNGTDLMIVGENGVNAEHRSFLTFDLSGITFPAVGATLQLQMDHYNFTSGMSFTAYDYVLGNDSLLGNSLTSLAAFADLGTGQIYGVAEVTSSANPVGSSFQMNLSAAAVSDINGQTGGLFTVGFADDQVTGSSTAHIRLDRNPSLRINQLLLWTDRVGIDPADVVVTNLDDDPQGLSVSILDDSISEIDGIEATVVTIGRNDESLNEVIVSLASSDTSEVAVQASVLIPAGQREITIPIEAVNDVIVDGSQSVTLTAAAAGFVSGTGVLTVSDVQADIIDDHVWLDANENGLRDSGEPGVEGAVVELFESVDGIVGNDDDISVNLSITDSQGQYQIAGLENGKNYYVHFRAPTGYVFSTQGVGNDDTIDSDVDQKGTTPLFLHTGGLSPSDVDAGLVGGPAAYGFTGRSGGSLTDNASAMDTDAAGNLYVSGSYRERSDFDFGPSEYFIRSVSTDDVYLAKYTPQGALIWARGIDGTGADRSTDLVVNESGDAFVTGSFQGTADFDPSTGTYELTSGGSADIFVWSLDRDGRFEMAAAMGGAYEDHGNSVALFPNGDVAIVGEFRGTGDFDPGSGVHSLVGSSNFRTDVFVVRLDASGQLQWANRTGGTNYDRGNGVSINAIGDIYVAGGFQGTADFDPDAGTDSRTAIGTQDSFLWKLSADGKLHWVKQWSGSLVNSAAYEVEVGDDGSVYSIGDFTKTIDLDPGDGIAERTTTPGSTRALFVTKLDASGDFVWGKSIGGTSLVDVKDAKLAANGDLYFAGSFSETVDFDPNVDTLIRTSAGPTDAYVSVLDSAGNLKWVQSVGGVDDDLGLAVAVANDGSAFLGGQYENRADFDPGAGTHELRTLFGVDLFVSKISTPLAPTSVQLLNDRIIESQPAGTVVGRFAATDPDFDESFHYRLATGVGDVDNGSFSVENGALIATEVFDQSVKDSYSVRVRAIDRSGRWVEQSLSVTVLPIANAGTIGNYIWHDTNENGIQDVGENGIEGAVVEIRSTADGLLRGRAITDSAGTYLVGGLVPGLDYHALVRPPLHFGFTIANAGPDDTLDSDADALGVTDSVTVNTGQSVDSLDVGLIGTAPYFGFAGKIGSNGDDIGQAVGTDSDGNLYVSGRFQNTVDFDPGPNTFERSSRGSIDIFVAKYSASGAFIWAETFGGSSADEAKSIDIANDGSVLISGSYQDVAEFGTGNQSTQLTSNGSTDAFVAKLDSDGNLRWARSVGSTSTDSADDVAVAGDGSVFAVGSFRNTPDFDPGENDFELSATGIDGFIWKLGSDGEFIWAGRVGGSSTVNAKRVALSSTGNAIVAGTFLGNLDVDPSVGVSALASSGSADVFVTAFDTNGNLLWGKQQGGNGSDSVNALTIGPADEIVMAGSFRGTADFDPGASEFELTAEGTSLSFSDAYATKLDAAGNFQWATRWGSPSVDDARGVSVGADGSVDVIGQFAGVSDFQTLGGNVTLSAPGTFDVLLTNLTATGEIVSVRSFGSAQADYGNDIVTLPDGSVFITGETTAITDMDPGGGVLEIIGGGRDDAFVSRIHPPQAPTALTLTEYRVLEQKPIHTNVGRLISLGGDPDGNHTYELVSGTGDDDNADFKIFDGVLSTASVLAHNGQPDRRIRVRVTDGSGLSFEQSLAVSVVEQSQAATISDAVWHDLNGNGLREVSENGIGGVVVEVFDEASHLSHGIVLTDSQGNYDIGELLPAADFRVQFRLPADLDFTTPNAGTDDQIDSDVDNLGNVSPVMLAPGQTLNHVSAGVVGETPSFGFAFGLGAEAESSSEERGRDVVIDSVGNIYAVGTFQGSVDFDPGPGVYELDSIGNVDTYVAKYTSTGALIWATQFGSTGSITGHSLEAVPGGGVLVSGGYNDTASLLGSSSGQTLTAAGGTDGFVASLTSDGQIDWAKSIGGTGNDWIYGMATAPDSSIVLTGYFNGTADFDPGAGTHELTSTGSEDAFVMKLDSLGDFVWAKSIGGSSFDRGYDVAVGPDGRVVTTGYYRFSADMDPGAATQTLTSAGGYDAFVSELDAAGNYLSSRSYGGPDSDYGYAVAVGSDGSVHAAGRFSNTVDFDSGVGVEELTSAGGLDAYLVKTDAAGSFQWAKQFGGTSNEFADAIALDGSNNVYLGGYDRVVAYDDRGQFRWTTSTPSRIVNESGLAVTSVGEIVVSAAFANISDFGPGGINYPLTAANNPDAFVWKFSQPDAPTAVSLAENRVLEQQPAGTIVGLLSATDISPEESFSFQLVSGPGDQDNASFEIQGDVLVASTSFDHSVQSTRNVRVAATNSQGLTYSDSITVEVQEISTAASVGNRVWNDFNGNGLQDAGEPGVSGVVAEIIATDDQLSRGMVVTDANGYYQIDALLPNLSYQVAYRLPADFEFTLPNVGSDSQIDSDARADGSTVPFTLASGETFSDLDAGVVGGQPSFGFAFSLSSENSHASNAIELDNEGNFYVTGTFRGVADFDPGPGVSIKDASGNSNSGFVAKYSPAGALIWVAEMSGSSIYGQDLAVDDNGNVYVTGSYDSSLNYEIRGSVSRLGTTGGTKSIFVAKLAPDGNAIWLKGFNGGRGEGSQITVTDGGDVLTAGTFSGSIDFDPGPGVHLSNSGGLFLSRLDANGDFVWVKQISANSAAMELASDGSLYLGGTFRGTTDFDPGPDAYLMSSNVRTRNDGFIAKLDAQGDFLWAKKTSGNGQDDLRGLAVTSDGGVVATGSFQYTADFDPSANDFLLTASGSQRDAFVWKLDANGDLGFATHFPASFTSVGTAVQGSGDGSLYVAVSFAQTVDIDPGVGVFEQSAATGYESFIVRLDASANLQWGQTFGVSNIQQLSILPDESVMSTGIFSGTTVDFDPRAGQYPLSTIGSDAFIARHFAPQAPSSVTLPIDGVFEGLPVGSQVGPLSAVDPDSRDVFTFELVAGTGDSDNGSFIITDGVLRTAAVFDESVKNSYSVRVKATDAAGLAVETPLTVQVLAAAQAASASGRVWNDINQDGLRDDSEPTVDAVVAQLMPAGERLVLQTVEVSADGQYSFSGLVPGVDYAVGFRIPNGYQYTLQNVGVDETLGSDTSPDGLSDTFSLVPGQSLTNVDAGLTGTPNAFGFAIPLGGDSNDEGRAVAIDSAGSVYVAGKFASSIDFDPGPGEAILQNEGSEDAFFAKYTRSGVLVWAKQLKGGTGLDAIGIHVAGNGDVTLTGNFNGETNFDPGATDTTLDVASSHSYVLRFNGAGDFVWVRAIQAGVRDLAVADNGDLLFTGVFSNGPVDFDPGTGTFEMTNEGSSDRFVLNLNNAGQFNWATQFGLSGINPRERVDVDSSGHVYVTGSYSGITDFEAGPYTTSLQGGGGFTMRLQPDGTLDWVRPMNVQYGRAVAAADDGTVYSSGLFLGRPDVDPGFDEFYLQAVVSEDIPVYQYDLPIIKLDANGEFGHAFAFTGIGSEGADDLEINASGRLAGAGYLQETVDFDPSAEEQILTSAGEYDAAVFSLDPSGTDVLAYRFGGIEDDFAYGVDIGSDGSVAATGYFQATATLDPLVSDVSLASAGGRDAFLLHFTSNRSPEAIALSNSNILKESPVGELVGVFSTTDPNVGDSFSYTLVSGNGDDDNGLFRIVNAQLETDGAIPGLDPLSIRVRSTDRDGQWFESTFVISVTTNVDVPPAVESVVRVGSSPTNASTLQYTVTFSEPVAGVDAGDFSITATSVTGTSVTQVAGNGAVYTVTIVATGGEGIVRMDVIDDDSIIDSIGQSLGGSGANNGAFNTGEEYVVDLTPPQVISVQTPDVSPTNANEVDFVVTFSELVGGVDDVDFSLIANGLTGVSISNITQAGSVYTVTVDSGSGDGTLRLDVLDDDSITDARTNPLGGPGAGNGGFTSSNSYTFDRTGPSVDSIRRVGASPTDSASIDFTVTFTEDVTGVDLDDFSLALTGLPGAEITSLSGSGSVYTVTVSTGLGDGTIRLNVVDDDTIKDAYNNFLGGTGINNGGFDSGEIYVVDRTGELFGRKWHDLDGDGLWDSSEPGLAGVMVYLDLNGNGQYDATEPTAITSLDDPATTDVDETGNYRFSDLGPGNYDVGEFLPAGWTQTYPVEFTGGTGELTFVEALRDGVNGIDGLDEAAGVTVSPDGNHIYVASYTDDSVTVLQRDHVTGQATLLQVVRNNVSGVTGLNGAQSVVVSPDGKNVYVSSDFDDSVVVFDRDQSSGLVTYSQRLRDGVDGVNGIDSALSIVISPDGAHVYAGGALDDSVAAFSRDPDTGNLTFVQSVTDGVNGFSGLDFVFSLAISADGHHLYVTGSDDDALTVISRNPTTGMLTHVQTLRDGVGGVDGLNLASGVTIAPDGNHVYVAGKVDDAIAVFARNDITGELTFAQKRTVSSFVSNVLDGVISVSISPDGENVYVTNDFRDKIGVFSRNPVTGHLGYLQDIADNAGGVDGLNQAWFSTVSPDGKNVYVVGATDDALVTFTRDAGTSSATSHNVTIGPSESKGPFHFGNVGVFADPVTRFVRQAPLTPITNSDVLVFHAEFTAPVTQIHASDFAVSGSSTAVVSEIAAVAGTGETVYAITVSGGDLASYNGLVGIDLAANQDIVNLLGNPLPTIEPAMDEVFTVDNLAPQVAEFDRGEGGNSVIDSIAVSFDSIVTLVPGAITLTRNASELVDLVATPSIVDNATVVVLTFSGASTESGGALIDGDYELRVLHSHVHDLANNNLDGDSDGNAGVDAVDQFYRFFGDSDGDRDVDGQDYGRFALTFLKTVGDPEFDPLFDSDRDGDVDGQDYGRFGLRFLRQLD
ncbi:SdrD B-like domain-containing protein [Stieleria maiorica]|nr:SdrD B-like domain-containing protein [Stieleria maiorica]